MPDTESIKRAQEWLKEREHYHGPLDGRMGPATREAIEEYQRAHTGMKVTGELDTDTLTAMDKEREIHFKAPDLLDKQGPGTPLTGIEQAPANPGYDPRKKAHPEIAQPEAGAPSAQTEQQQATPQPGARRAGPPGNFVTQKLEEFAETLEIPEDKQPAFKEVAPLLSQLEGRTSNVSKDVMAGRQADAADVAAIAGILKRTYDHLGIPNEDRVTAAEYLKEKGITDETVLKQANRAESRAYGGHPPQGHAQAAPEPSTLQAPAQSVPAPAEKQETQAPNRSKFGFHQDADLRRTRIEKQAILLKLPEGQTPTFQETNALNVQSLNLKKAIAAGHEGDIALEAERLANTIQDMSKRLGVDAVPVEQYLENNGVQMNDHVRGIVNEAEGRAYDGKPPQRQSQATPEQPAHSAATQTVTEMPHEAEQHKAAEAAPKQDSQRTPEQAVSQQTEALPTMPKNSVPEQNGPLPHMPRDEIPQQAGPLPPMPKHIIPETPELPSQVPPNTIPEPANPEVVAIKRIEETTKVLPQPLTQGIAETIEIKPNPPRSEQMGQETIAVTGEAKDAAAPKQKPGAARSKSESELSSEDVLKLQQKLTDMGFNPEYNQDGKLGPTTENAIKIFQQRAGLEQTGVPDVETLAKLEDLEQNAKQYVQNMRANSPQSIKDAQMALNLVSPEGKEAGAVDGDWGPKTTAAVTAFNQAEIERNMQGPAGLGSQMEEIVKNMAKGMQYAGSNDFNTINAPSGGRGQNQDTSIQV